MNQASCYKNPVKGEPRLLEHRHVRDCNLSGCPGCEPCPEKHCTRCQFRHLDDNHKLTCPHCVGKAREALGVLDDLVRTADAEYVNRSIGSMVTVAAGPTADAEAYAYLYDSAVTGRMCKCHRRGEPCPSTIVHAGPVCDRRCAHRSCTLIRTPQLCPDVAHILADNRGEPHPATVLGEWDVIWRRHLGHNAPPVTTYRRAVDYLTANLTYMAQVADPSFRDFTSSVRTSTEWLRRILGLTEDAEGAPCPMCGKENLVKEYDDTDEGTPWSPDRERKMLATVDPAVLTDEPERPADRYADMWVCPNPSCHQTYTDEEYRTKVEGTYMQVADRLTASQIHETYRINPATLRSWAHRGKVRQRGRDSLGRQLYDVADALALRDVEATP